MTDFIGINSSTRADDIDRRFQVLGDLADVRAKKRAQYKNRTGTARRDRLSRLRDLQNRRVQVPACVNFVQVSFC